MTSHVAIVGIDGSGKSTVAQALPAILAAEHGLTAGAAGARFQVVAPRRDLLVGPLAEAGRPWSVRLAGVLRAVAKRASTIGWLYVVLKLLHMLVQDAAARALGRRYGAQVLVSDGNTLLCAMGRAMNYLAPARERSGDGRAATAQALGAFLCFLRDGGPAPRGVVSPWIAHVGRVAYLALRRIGLDALWLPGRLVFLDVPVDAALARIAARGEPRDPHENAEDMAQARASYLAALALVERLFPACAVTVLEAGAQQPSETISAVKQILGCSEARLTVKPERALGTTPGTRTWRRLLGRVLQPRYVQYQLRHAQAGAWRELLFVASPAGRQLLSEGYSANTMAAIYGRDGRRESLAERLFQEYPLHRAVYDRLHLLVPRLEALLERELAARGRARVFTAPSGHAEDLFRALERLATRRSVAGVELVAADLDPDGRVATRLAERAARLGVGLRFRRCDLTTDEGRCFAAQHGPYALALFVGLSSWLPKPAMRTHLASLARVLAPGGRLVTDCFSAAPYAVAGCLAGYEANYFTSQDYAAFVCDAGFALAGDGSAGSGRDGLNHVLVFAPGTGSSRAETAGVQATPYLLARRAA